MKAKKIYELYRAVVDDDMDLVKELIAKGFDVDKKDDNYFTPLHYAAQNFSTQNNGLEIAKMLINKGCDIESKDDYGNTPLSNAVFWFRGNPGMINLLLENGADKFNENNYGVSPYSLAESIGNYPVF